MKQRKSGMAGRQRGPTLVVWDGDLLSELVGEAVKKLGGKTRAIAYLRRQGPKLARATLFRITSGKYGIGRRYGRIEGAIVKQLVVLRRGAGLDVASLKWAFGEEDALRRLQAYLQEVDRAQDEWRPLRHARLEQAMQTVDRTGWARLKRAGPRTDPGATSLAVSYIMAPFNPPAALSGIVRAWEELSPRERVRYVRAATAAQRILVKRPPAAARIFASGRGELHALLRRSVLGF